MTFDSHSIASLRPHAGLVLLLFGLLAQPARAQSSPGLELSWLAPDECPDQARVQAQISRLAPSPAPREQPLRVQGTVRREHDGFTLELVLRDGEFVGRRRFESDSCAEVVGAAAVTVALLLSSGAEAGSGAGATSGAGAASGAGATSGAGAASGTQAAPVQSAAPTDATTPNTDNARGPSDPKAATVAAERQSAAPDRTEGNRTGNADSESRWQLVLAAPSVSAGFGLLPQPSFGLGLGFAIEVDPWRLFAGGTWNLDVSVRRSDSTDWGAEVSRGTGRMGGCRWLGPGRLQWGPCVAIALHYLRARGVGADISAEAASYAWLALGPSVLAHLRLSDRVGLSASAGLELQTVRPKFILEGLGEIEQIGALELTSLLGAEWIF